MQGRIIRGIAGFYYVHVPEEGILECKAKGIFRKNKVKPLVGDLVEVTLLEQKGKGNIEDILERRNQLIRPAVANIDQVMLIFAVAHPEPNFNLLDRFLLMMRQQKIPCILVFNKCELSSEDKQEELRKIYEKSGCKTLFISVKEGLGLEQLNTCLENKTTALAGPSGVGKSSMINLLQDSVSMETGEISKKIERGKHTTRHTEFIPLGRGGFILDTPGFSSLMVFDMMKEELSGWYPEFEELEQECRFNGCSHTHEPGCRVKEAVMKEEISKIRYENYCQIYEELKQQKKY